MEDGDWARADEYLEKALDHDPDNATAFLGKLLIELKLPTKERLKYQAEPFDNSNNYKRILRLGDERLINELEEYLKQIKKHIETEQQKAETARNEAIYANAMELMNSQMIWRASELFESIGSYKDASEKALECRKRAEAIRKKGALQQKQAMETELSNLKGPFASRRRKELEAIIDKLDKQIQSMNSKLNSLSR